jgi:GNAT superfamily N-acetyltransferase
MTRPSVGEPAVPGCLVDEIGAEWERTVDGDITRWSGYTPLWDPPESMRDPDGGRTATVVAELVDEQVRSILVRWNERTAKLWWVEVPETAATPPALNFVAYDVPVMTAGSIIDEAAFSSLGVTGQQQVGAYRWWPSTGEVHQMYVAPAERRHGIGIALGIVAWTYAWLRGWPPQFTGSYRTEQGEAFLETAKPWWAGRTNPLTHVAPPMTPGERSAP